MLTAKKPISFANYLIFNIFIFMYISLGPLGQKITGFRVRFPFKWVQSVLLKKIIHLLPTWRGEVNSTAYDY